MLANQWPMIIIVVVDNIGGQWSINGYYNIGS